MTAATQDEYDKYFQSDSTVETQRRRAAKSANARGSPIRVNKVSALAVDPSAPSSHVFIAEATGTVRRLELATGKLQTVLSGPVAPLTCLVAASGMVFAGCWDKCIYAARVAEGKGQVPQRFQNVHTDFIKCIAVYTPASIDATSKNSSTILVSGSADRSLAIWSVSSGKLLLQLKNHHTTSLTAVQVDPIESQGGKLVLFSGSSDGEIIRSVVSLDANDPGSTPKLLEKTTLPSAHPTSVYTLSWVQSADIDLLTSSADSTAAILSRFRNWEVETRLTHGGHVRCAAANAEGSRIVTGGRDEDVQVWDASEEQVLLKLEGHFDEVTAAVVMPVEAGGNGERVVSGSLDGTVRIWNLKEEVERLKSEQEGGGDGEEQAKEEAKEGPALTAEEEAELAELMDDSE